MGNLIHRWINSKHMFSLHTKTSHRPKETVKFALFDLTESSHYDCVFVVMPLRGSESWCDNEKCELKSFRRPSELVTDRERERSITMLLTRQTQHQSTCSIDTNKEILSSRCKDFWVQRFARVSSDKTAPRFSSIFIYFLFVLYNLIVASYSRWIHQPYFWWCASWPIHDDEKETVFFFREVKSLAKQQMKLMRTKKKKHFLSVLIHFWFGKLWTIDWTKDGETFTTSQVLSIYHGTEENFPTSRSTVPTSNPLLEIHWEQAMK